MGQTRRSYQPPKKSQPVGEQRYAALREREFQQRQFADQVSLLHQQAARRGWEDRSDLKRLDANARMRDARQAGSREDMLAARRCQLREKLEREDAALYAELAQPREAPEARREAMRARLAELRAQREAAQREQADRMYDYRWRLDCDELRAAVSAQHAAEVREDRDAQLAEKRQLRAEAEQEEALHHRLMEQDVARFQQEVKSETSGRREAERMRMEVLDKQRDARAREEERQRAEQDREAAELAARLAALRAEEEAEEKRGKEARRRCREELLADMAARRRAAEAERQRDLEVEREICARDNADPSRETTQMATRRAAQAQSVREFLAYLRQARVDEMAAEREVEKLIEADAERVYQRQREQWLAEQQRRKCLLQETIAIRRQQVQEKLARAGQERELDRAYQERLSRELERLERLDREREERLRAAERELATDLVAQQEYRRRQEQELQEEEARRVAAGLQQEEEYQQKLEACLREKVCERPHPWRREHRYFDTVANAGTAK